MCKFSNDHMFLLSKNIIIRPSLQNFVLSYNALRIVIVMCFQYDLHCLYKLLKNRTIPNVLTFDCVQIVCKNVKYI
jgi:hypothetical protein